jgi:hypothetical protein
MLVTSNGFQTQPQPTEDMIAGQLAMYNTNNSACYLARVRERLDHFLLSGGPRLK